MMPKYGYIPEEQKFGAMGEAKYWGSMPKLNPKYIPGGRLGQDAWSQAQQAYKQKGFGAAAGTLARGLTASPLAVVEDVLSPLAPLYEGATEGFRAFLGGDDPRTKAKTTNAIANAQNADSQAGDHGNPSIGQPPAGATSATAAATGTRIRKIVGPDGKVTYTNVGTAGTDVTDSLPEVNSIPIDAMNAYMGRPSMGISTLTNGDGSVNRTSSWEGPAMEHYRSGGNINEALSLADRNVQSSMREAASGKYGEERAKNAQAYLGANTSGGGYGGNDTMMGVLQAKLDRLDAASEPLLGSKSIVDNWRGRQLQKRRDRLAMSAASLMSATSQQQRAANEMPIARMGDATARRGHDLQLSAHWPKIQRDLEVNRLWGAGDQDAARTLGTIDQRDYMPKAPVVKEGVMGTTIVSPDRNPKTGQFDTQFVPFPTPAQLEEQRKEAARQANAAGR
jgi:hypothetical protein